MLKPIGMARVIAFDLIGTLFSLEALVEAARRFVDNAEGFVALWRSKQLEYAVLLSLMGRYEDFGKVTERALRYAARRFGVALSDDAVKALVGAWTRLRPYEDVPEVLPLLAERYTVVAVVNPHREMAEALLANAGLRRYFAELFTSDRVGVYKPSPRVYLMVTELGVRPSDAAMVTANPWDAAGAANAGLKAVYLNRSGLPEEELGLKPAAVVRDLRELAAADL